MAGQVIGDGSGRGTKVAIELAFAFALEQELVEVSRRVGEAARDLNEFLFERKREGQFNRDFRSTPGTVAYHLPCHLKAQNIGFRSRDMMKLIPEAKITMVEQCSGHD